MDKGGKNNCFAGQFENNINSENLVVSLINTLIRIAKALELEVSEFLK